MVCSAFYRGGLTLLKLLALIGISLDLSLGSGRPFLDPKDMQKECYKTFTEYRRKAGLPPIPWDGNMYNYLQNQIVCGTGTVSDCSMYGKFSSNGLSWGGLQNGNATTLCANAALTMINNYASNYQYPGAQRPWNECPGTKQGRGTSPVHKDNLQESFGALFSNKIKKFACGACQCNPDTDPSYVLMECATEPDFRNYTEAFWNEANYKAFCSNFPGHLTGCDDAPNVTGCGYKGDNRTKSTTSPSHGSQKSTMPRSQSTDHSQKSTKMPSQSTEDGSKKSSTDSSHGGSNSETNRNDENQLYLGQNRMDNLLAFDSANAIMPGHLCIILTILCIILTFVLKLSI